MGVAITAMNNMLTGDSLVDNLKPIQMNLPCKSPRR